MRTTSASSEGRDWRGWERFHGTNECISDGAGELLRYVNGRRMPCLENFQLFSGAGPGFLFFACARAFVSWRECEGESTGGAVAGLCGWGRHFACLGRLSPRARLASPVSSVVTAAKGALAICSTICSKIRIGWYFLSFSSDCGLSRYCHAIPISFLRHTRGTHPRPQ